MATKRSDFRTFPYFSMTLFGILNVWFGWDLLTSDHHSSLLAVFEFLFFCAMSLISLFGLFVFGLMLRAWFKAHWFSG